MTTAGRPIEDASTIPASWYFDPGHHRRELELVFARTWQQVARVDQVRREGDYVATDLAGEPVLVVRGRSGPTAMSNVCRHRAGQVAVGEGCARAFSCSYHGWTYALDGSLLAAPEMEGVRGFDRRGFGLPAMRCEAWGPAVFVNLDPQAPDLKQVLGALVEMASPFRLEEIPFTRRVTYEIACNWKVYIDNYLEGYHIPKAHPGLNKVLDYRKYTVRAEGWFVTQEAPARESGKERAKAASRRGGGEEPRSLYFWLYPNFMLNINPAYVQSNLIVPLGPERTLCIFDYYFAATKGKAAPRSREKSIAWADEIQQEDIRICETVQRNLHSRTYTAGRYSAKRENGLYHFHELLRRALA
jgi:choline monooxygenase